MIDLIILCILLFIVASFLYYQNEINSKDSSPYPLLIYFLNGFLIVGIFIFALMTLELRKKAEGKCPELTPVKEQLYKVK